MIINKKRIKMSVVNVYIRESSSPPPGKNISIAPQRVRLCTLALKELRARYHESGLDIEAADAYLDTESIRLQPRNCGH